MKRFVRADLKKIVIEAKDFDFRSKTMFCKWSGWDMRITMEGRYKYKAIDLRYEIARVEQAIDNGEFPCNAKNQRYVSNLYKELNRLIKAA